MRARYTVVNGEVIAEKRSGTRRSYVPCCKLSRNVCKIAVNLR